MATKTAPQQSLRELIGSIEGYRKTNLCTARLVKKTGIDRSYISQIAAGRFKSITPENIARIAKALRVKAEVVSAAAQETLRRRGDRDFCET